MMLPIRLVLDTGCNIAARPAIALLGKFHPNGAALDVLAHPNLYAPAFIATLAGLAMLRVLQTAFNTAFRERFTLGALVTFIVTVADVPIFNVGAPFWGLVIGYAASRLLEGRDFGAARA